jgi:signal transduction histidine kinase
VRSAIRDLGDVIAQRAEEIEERWLERVQRDLARRPDVSPSELRDAMPGSGLGLAITRRSIEAQGGSLHVESQDPVACHFWIELPER